MRSLRRWQSVAWQPMCTTNRYRYYLLTRIWDLISKIIQNAYALFENAITLPLHTKLTDEEVKYVTDVLKECIG